MALLFVLAGCQATLTPAPAPVRDFAFATNWQVRETGEPARCEDMLNVWEYGFTVTDPSRVISITEQYVGSAPAGVEPRRETRTINRWQSGSDWVRVRHTFPPGDTFVPVSVADDFDAQSIVIVPEPVTPTEWNGETSFRVSVRYETSYGERTVSSPWWHVDSYRNCAR